MSTLHAENRGSSIPACKKTQQLNSPCRPPSRAAPAGRVTERRPQIRTTGPCWKNMGGSASSDSLSTCRTPRDRVIRTVRGKFGKKTEPRRSNCSDPRNGAARDGGDSALTADERRTNSIPRAAGKIAVAMRRLYVPARRGTRRIQSGDVTTPGIGRECSFFLYTVTYFSRTIIDEFSWLCLTTGWTDRDAE